MGMDAGSREPAGEPKLRPDSQEFAARRLLISKKLSDILGKAIFPALYGEMADITGPYAVERGDDFYLATVVFRSAGPSESAASMVNAEDYAEIRSWVAESCRLDVRVIRTVKAEEDGDLEFTMQVPSSFADPSLLERLLRRLRRD